MFVNWSGTTTQRSWKQPETSPIMFHSCVARGGSRELLFGNDVPEARAIIILSWNTAIMAGSAPSAAFLIYDILEKNRFTARFVSCLVQTMKKDFFVLAFRRSVNLVCFRSYRYFSRFIALVNNTQPSRLI